MAKKVENKDLFADDLFKSTVKDVELLIAELDKLEKSIVEVAKAQKTILGNSDTKSIEGIRATNESIKKLSETEKMHLKLQQDKLTLENKLKAARTNQAQQNTELNVLVQQQNRINKQAVLENEKLNGSYSAQSARLNRLRKEYKDLATSKGATSVKAKELLKEITRLDTKLKDVDKTVGQSQRNVGNYGSAFSRLGGILKGGLGALGITAGIAGLVRGIGAAIGIFKDFEAANSKLKSVLGATEGDMKLLSDQAKELGASTAFTASQVTDLQTEFAKLGFPTKEILNMTESTLNAAAAMGSQLGEQAALTGATIKAFGLSSKDAARVNDVLAKSTARSALDFSKLNASMSTIAPVANAMGFGLEDTVALLGNLSDSGFDASTASTATRNIMLKLADSSSTLGKRLKEPVKDLPSLIRGLKQLTSEGVDLTQALELTDVRSVAAFATFMKGTDSLERLSAELNNASGAAKEMADTMLDNLSGDMTKATSAWEGFILSLEDGDGVISRVMRNATQSFTNFLSKLTELNKTSKQIINEATNVASKKLIGNLLSQIEDEKKALKKQSDEEISILESRKNRGLMTELNYNKKIIEIKANLEKQTNELRLKAINNEISSTEKSLKSIETNYKEVAKNAETILSSEIKIGKLKGFDILGLGDKITPEALKQQRLIAQNYLEQKEILAALKIELLNKEDIVISDTKTTEENTTATDKNNKSKEKKIKLDKYIVDKSFEQQDALDKENQAKLDAYEKEQKALEELRKAQGEYEDYLLKQYKTDEEGFKLKEQQRKELTEATLEVISTMLEEYHKRELEAIDKQIAATEKRVDQLRKKAELGQLASEESLAFEEKKQAELEQKRLQAQKRQQREQALFTVISTYQSKIAAGDKSPLLSTIKDIAVLKSFASTLAGFYEGTDDVGKSLGKPQLSGKDGHIVRVDGKEQIWSAKDRAAVGFRSRDEIKDLVGLVDNGLINNITNRDIFNPNSFVVNGLMDKKVLSKLDGIEKAIAKIDIPEGMVKIDEVRGLINLYSQKSNKKTIERSKLFN